MSTEIEVQNLKLKLEFKKQWFCDYCGGIIESENDGMLEWDTFLLDDKKLKAENFRIVHGGEIKNCVPRYDDNLSDGHLGRFTDSQGLSELLYLASTHKLDTIKFYTIIRRLHVDFYEEAIQYLPLALADEEYDIDPNGIGDITESNLIWLIKKYGK